MQHNRWFRLRIGNLKRQAHLSCRKVAVEATHGMFVIDCQGDNCVRNFEKVDKERKMRK